MSDPRSDSDPPFPGLRSFESHEATLFFGREEQCDALLARLARRKMVGVIGASGSGKSSLVKAGLVPALERGYLSGANPAWRIARCQPGTDPLGNLARSLHLRRESAAGPQPTIEQIRSCLDDSSLGLVEASRQVIDEGSESLLLIVDQFEELFAFQRAGGTAAAETAAAFARLLVCAAEVDYVNIYVVLTMRSEYLGDCAQFSGLPEAINEGQFLVPRMTREQLKEAIEGPVAVRRGSITPGLVQRLLHDAERLASGGGREAGGREPDPLPLLQHVLLRLWNVSWKSRQHGEPIDLPHYENPPVSTIWQALNLHAEEAFAELTDIDSHRIAEHAFRQLTERDPMHREIRRKQDLRQLAAIALHLDRAPTGQECDRVRAVLQPFADPGRSFVIVDRNDVIDISHESLIRQWTRLSRWVENEAESKHVFTTLAQWAIGWSRGERALYHGPELSEALRWKRLQAPSLALAKRYDVDWPLVLRFLEKSRRRQLTIRLGLLAVSAGIVALVTFVVLLRQQQRAKIDAAYDAQKALVSTLSRLQFDITQSNRLLAEAARAQNEGNQPLASRLREAAERKRQSVESRQAEAATKLADAERTLKAVEPRPVSPPRSDEVHALPVEPPVDVLPPLPTVPPPDSVGAARPQPAASPASLDARPTIGQQALPGALPETPAPAAKGDFLQAFRDGVSSAAAGRWSRTVQSMRDAIRFQAGSSGSVKPVRINGTWFEPYAPYSYLALGLILSQPSQCGDASDALLIAARETKSRELETNLNNAKRKCLQ